MICFYEKVNSISWKIRPANHSCLGLAPKVVDIRINKNTESSCVHFWHLSMTVCLWPFVAQHRKYLRTQLYRVSQKTAIIMKGEINSTLIYFIGIFVKVVLIATICECLHDKHILFQIDMTLFDHTLWNVLSMDKNRHKIFWITIIKLKHPIN